MERATINLSRAVTSPANVIFIIDCLGVADAQSSIRRHEGILDELLALDLSGFDETRQQIKRVKALDLQELVLVLEKIRGLCKQGVVPLIFIDGHGDSEKGLKLSSEQFMNWGLLLRKMNHITRATGGELTIIAAFCHSMAAMKYINTSQKLPFSFYYGYESEISAGIVEEETRIIYQSLLRDGGKSWATKQLQISGYSEYDHVNPLLARAVMLAEAPNHLATIEPRSARGVLRREVEKGLAARGVPLSGIGKFFNEAVRTSNLTTEIIMRLMHDTERRRLYLDDIRRQVGNSRR